MEQKKIIMITLRLKKEVAIAYKQYLIEKHKSVTEDLTAHKMCIRDRFKIIYRADSAAHGKWDKNRFRYAAHHIHHGIPVV